MKTFGIDMHFLRNTVEIAFGALAVILGSLFLCYAWPDKDYGLSGWVQAAGSIAAILGSVWAAVHATASANKSREEDARQAGASQVVFTRALLTQATDSILMIESYARLARVDSMKREANALLEIIQTFKSLIIASKDAGLTSLLVRAYEPMVICHSTANSAKNNETDIGFVEWTSSKAVKELDQLRIAVKSIAERLGAPAAPPGPKADFDVLPEEEPE